MIAFPLISFLIKKYAYKYFRSPALQIQLERGKHAEQERLFLVYAKQWWKEYLTIREIHKERLVKIFAQVLKILS